LCPKIIQEIAGPKRLMPLELEQLESRLLLAAPDAPESLGLWLTDDSGPQSSLLDASVDITSDFTLRLAAEAGDTVKIYNLTTGIYLGTATDTADNAYFESGGMVVMEAEHGTITGMNTATDSSGDPSEGSYIYDPNTDGDARFYFYISTVGDYNVYCRTKYSSTNNNSFYVNIDDVWTNPETGPAVPNASSAFGGVWHLDTVTTTVNQDLGDVVWTLEEGWHFLEVHTRESGSWMDRIIINKTTNPAPVDPGDAESSCVGLYEYTFAAGELQSSAAGTDNLLIATVMNGSDETSNPSEIFTVTYDNTAPAQPGTPDLTSAHDMGESSSDNITNKADPTITGTAEADSTVTINVNAGAHTGTTTADAIGNWSYGITSGWLNAGANTIFVTAEDSVGNTSIASGNLVITSDTAVPAAPATPDLDAGSDTGGSNSDNYTSDTTPTISGTCEANATITINLNNVDITTVADSNGDGLWSYTFSNVLTGSATGTANSIKVKQTDLAGNTSAAYSAVLTVTLDTSSSAPAGLDMTAGTDTGTTNSDDITNNDNCVINGTCEADATVHIYVNGTEEGSVVDGDGDGNWSYTFQNSELVEGNNAITATAEDNAGNAEGVPSSTLTITLDTILATPAVPDLQAGSDSGDSDDNITSTNNPVFDGYVEPGTSVQLKVETVATGAAATANATTGYWSKQLTGGDVLAVAGDYDITITVTDTAGNSLTSSVLTITYYPTGAQPATPKLMTATDSGSSNSDGITNVSAATVYGSVAGANTVEANATVHVRIAAVEVGTTVADDNGNWSYTFDGDLAVGANQVSIYITNLADEDSIASNNLTVTYDITANAPAAAPDLLAAGDTGTSNSDNITSDTNLTFTGANNSVEAGARVYLRVNGSAVNNVLADGNGAYSVTGTLAEGTNTVDIYYVDTAGNTSTDSANLSVVVDATISVPSAPDLDSGSDTGTSSSDDYTGDTMPTISGTCESGATISIHLNGADAFATTSDAADGSTDGIWTYTFGAGINASATGTANTIKIAQTDTAGNTSAYGATLTITVDSSIAQPVLPDMADASDTGSDNDDDLTSETRPTIQGMAGSVEGSCTVHIWLDRPSFAAIEAGTAAAAVNGSWSYTFDSDYPLEEGDNLIYVVAEDAAGNSSVNSPVLTVTIDFDIGAESPPDLIAASDTGTFSTDNITNDSTPTIIGTCPSGAQIKIRTNETTIVTFTDNDATDGNVAAGQWSYTYPAPLADGVYTIDFLTIDTSNSTTDWSQDLVITLDTSIEQPTLPDLSTASDSGSDSADNITNINNPTLTGTAKANSTVTIYVNANNTTTSVGANGIWSYQIINPAWLSEGANTIYVKATDIAGNTSVNSTSLTLTLDATITEPATPTLAAATDTGTPGDNTTSHANPRIEGTADASTTITIRLDPAGAATTIGTTTASVTGTWSYTFASDDLATGNNIIDVISTDTAGNTDDSSELTINIERLVNIPSNLDLAAASDLGDADDDDLTSKENAQISGQADASCTIYIRVNGTEIGSTTSNGAGNWSYTFDGVDDLIEGVNLIDAYAEDSVGNVSGYSSDLQVELDTAVAVPLTPDLATASDSGSSDTDNYTNVTTATISGTCEQGATVYISLNGDDNFDSVQDADVDGNWSYTFPAMGGLNGSAAGTANTIKVKQQDTAGNESAFGTTITITLDSSASLPSTPDLLAVTDTGDLSTDNITNQPNCTITGTVENSSSLKIYVGAGLIDTISETLISSGIWTYTLSTGQLSEGANLITIIATDKAGNDSAASAALTVTLDRTIAQPALPDLTTGSDTGDHDDDEVTSDETPTFEGTADANVHVTIRVDGEPVNTVDSNGAGNWSYTFVQGEIQTGVHQVDVIATDAAGNTSTSSDDLMIWLNVQPTQPATPNLKSQSDSGTSSTDNITNVTNPILDGKADPYDTVWVYLDGSIIGSATADGDGFWEYTVTAGVFSEGDNVITIITEDSSGLQSTSSYPLTIELDITAPTAAIPDLRPGSDTGFLDDDNRTTDETATIEGTTDASALIDLYLNDAFVTQLVATSLGQWSYTFAPDALQSGDNDIYVIITDVAYNISDASPVLTVVLDLDQGSPDVPLLEPTSDTGSSDADQLTNITTPAISGTVKADSSVQILVDGTAKATVQADGTGAWSYTFESDQLTEGLNHIEVIGTDSVGNTARSATLALTIDTTAPIIYNHFPAGTYVHTTSTVELYISGNDLDTLLAADTSGYILTGSGGDGTFDDGNEWTIPISNITVNSIAGLVQLSSVITLTDDTYQLAIDPTVSLKDQAGNAAVLNLSAQHGNPLSQENQQILLTFVIDTEGPPAPQAPELDTNSDSGTDNSDYITNNNHPLIHITANPQITVELICNGYSAGFAEETTPGSYQIYISSALIRQGENLLLARAYDSLGNSSELSDLQIFTYDSQAPEIAAIVVDSQWINYGPTEISVVFAESDINPDAVTEISNYLLIASGGDGTFDDGNETTIDIISVSHTQTTGTVTLTLPQTVTGTSQLGPDTYRLEVLGTGTIADITGNLISESSTQDFAVVSATTIHRNEKYQFIDGDGNTVFVALYGDGDALILEGDAVGSENTIEKIILSNTNAKTTLKVWTRNGKLPLTIGQILADSPLATISIAQAQVTQAIEIADGISRLIVGSIADNATVNIVADNVQITTAYIGDNSQINITGNLDKLLVNSGDMGGDVSVSGDIDNLKATRGNITGNISAANIGSISTNQLNNALIRAGASITKLTSQSGQNSKISAGSEIISVRFRGDLADSTISAGGNITTIDVTGDALDNLFLSGADLGADGSLDGTADLFSDGDIAALHIRGSYLGSIAAAAVNPGSDLGYFTGDDSAASGNIDSVRFGRTSLDTTLADNPFGLLAGDSITPFRVRSQLYAPPYQLNSFRLELVP